ncbi:MAG TPA: hypothetical protein V6C81_27060 [Planktothrix sp.]|jgi:NAD+ synthase (glutamine-hydrolysing)
MQLINCGVASMNTVPFDWARNTRIAKNVISDFYKRTGGGVLTLHELWGPDYAGEDDHQRPHFLERQWELLEEIVEFAKDMPVIFNVDIAVMHEDRLYNCTFLCSNGMVHFGVAKRRLAEGRDYRENHQFKAYPTGKREFIIRRGKRIPFGDIYGSFGGTRLAVWKCQEMWEFNGIAEKFLAHGIKLIMSPNASLFARGKFAKRKQIYCAGAMLSQSVVMAALQHGSNGKIINDGGSMICTGGAEPVAMTRRFPFTEYELVTHTVDLDEVRVNRAISGSNSPALEAPAEGECIEVGFAWPHVELKPQEPFKPEEWELSPYLDLEEQMRGTALAERDWLMKSRLNGAYISQSGGRDSAICSVISSTMVDLELKERGVEGFHDDFAHVPAIKECRTAEQFKRKLIKTAYKASKNSGKDTRKAARMVSKEVGAQHFHFMISAVVALIVKMVEIAIGRKLKWKDASGDNDTIALENVQARTRAVISWMMANVFGLLLITTSNRSEGCTGYWTAGGDGEGGLALISGWPKLLVCQIVLYMRDHGLVGLKPFRSLKYVTNLQASAELQPPEMGQTDEDALAPFPVLYEIENHARLLLQSPLEIVISLKAKMPQYTLRLCGKWVEKWFRLWSRNQWKRDQATSGLQTTEFNVDKRGGTDISIIHSGYREELERMWAYINAHEPESK